jgi:hypothetical protein
MNIDFIKPASALMTSRPLQHDSACRYTTVSLLKLGYMQGNGRLNCRTPNYALKIDFNGCLHKLTFLSLLPTPSTARFTTFSRLDKCIFRTVSCQMLRICSRRQSRAFSI